MKTNTLIIVSCMAFSPNLSVQNYDSKNASSNPVVSTLDLGESVAGFDVIKDFG
jgi:hypothetical protein